MRMKSFVTCYSLQGMTLSIAHMDPMSSQQQCRTPVALLCLYVEQQLTPKPLPPYGFAP